MEHGRKNNSLRSNSQRLESGGNVITMESGSAMEVYFINCYYYHAGIAWTLDKYSVELTATHNYD